MTVSHEWHTISTLRAAFRERHASPVEITDAYLKRIACLDPEIDAYQIVCPDRARKSAVAAEMAIAAGTRVGPLNGVPFALKDVFDVAGLCTAGGSLERLGNVPLQSGAIVRRLLSAGAVLLGKTQTVETAFGGWGTNRVMGTPRNPWDWQALRVPGGSSSGSAAALAADLTVCALGTDTGGSVRLPAAYCGVSALKVTEGVLPTDGIMRLSHTLDTPGPMARCTEDLLILLQVMAGRKSSLIERDMAARSGAFLEMDKGVSGLTLGVLPEAEQARCSANVRALYRAAIDRFDALGARMVTFPLALSFSEIARETGLLIAAEAWFHHGALYGDPTAVVDEDVRPRVLAGRSVTASDYMRVLQARIKASQRFLDTLQTFDALITPTTESTAPRLAEVDQNSSPGYFTRAVNFLGLCAVSTPAGLTVDGLPVGLQIIARGQAETMALRISAAFESDAAALDRSPCVQKPANSYSRPLMAEET